MGTTRTPQKVRTRRVKPEVTVNLVRDKDSDTYAVVSDYDMIKLHTTHTIIHEKGLVEGKMFGNFYIKAPK